jgi:hypothetical protein
MSVLQKERLTSIEGFLTNINFPGSKAATRTNTPSKAVYESRKLLEQDNELQEKVAELNKLGQEISAGVNRYKQNSARLVSLIKSETPTKGELKLSNVHINKMYTDYELSNIVNATDIDKKAVAWAFKKIYDKIPDGEVYPVAGGVTLSSYGPLNTQSYVVANQGKKLSFKQCKELAAQTGYAVFGMTNATIQNGVYVSTCLLPNMEDVKDCFKWGTVQDKNRMPKVQNATKNISFSARDGNAGSTPLYNVSSFTSFSVPQTRYYKPYNNNPGVALKGIFSDRANSDALMKKYNITAGLWYDDGKKGAWVGLGESGAGVQQMGKKYFAYGGMYAAQDLARDASNYDATWNQETYTLTAEKDDGTNFGGMEAYWVDGDVEGYINELSQMGGKKEAESFLYNGPTYQAQYGKGVTIPLAGSFGLWKIDDTDTKTNYTLAENGVYNVSKVAPQMYLNRTSLSVAEWEKVQKSKDNQNILGSWMTTAISNLRENKNLAHIGFFYKHSSDTNGELIAFGTPTTDPNAQIDFTFQDDKGIRYGDKNTITYYLVTEKYANGEYGFSRAFYDNILGKVMYIDEKERIRSYPKSMLTPKDPNITQYKLQDNTNSDYFNLDIIPLSELQKLTMTIPKCKELCNKYYDQCDAFVFDGAAQTRGLSGVADGTVMPKCSLKKHDPSVFSWATEEKNYSRLYTKIPQVLNNWTCSKKIVDMPASYVISGVRTDFGDSEYMGLDDKGNEIEPLKRGEVMNAKKKCGSWQQFETDSKTLKEMQNKIAGNIEKYAVLLNELKEYNSELIQNASINQPMVDVAVKEYNDIMTNIQDYAATGEFRIDKYKTEMSDVSRKSYVYIYIIWLTIAVIIIYFAVKTLMKTMKKN